MSDYSVKDHIAYKMGYKAGQEAQAARIAELEGVLDQLLDDMHDGLCVCEQAKEEARAALEEGK